MVRDKVNLDILDASNERDRSAWLSLWDSWPSQEVSGHPSYVRLFARSCDRVMCAAVRGEAAVLFPFILRPLSAEPWAPARTETWDLTSPYGYGGPFAWGQPPAPSFWAQFDAWATSSRVVSGFARLSLFEADLLQLGEGRVEALTKNVVRKLDGSMDEIWADYDHKVRKNVKAARRAGVRIELDTDARRIREFIDVYYETMDRRRAGDQYYWPEAFFRTLAAELQGHVAMFHARWNDAVVSTELILVSRHSVYSFLGGTRAMAFEVRPNDLIKHSIVEWAKGAGKKFFVLGGGYSENDGIVRYKAAFAPRGLVPFKVWCRIFDSHAYEGLVSARMDAERRNGREWSPAPRFFPAYRG